MTTSQTNINKEQDVLIKDLNSLKANLFSGFIIIIQKIYISALVHKIHIFVYGMLQS